MSGQNTSQAVMAQRGTPAKGLDFFPTPPWAARAGGELIARLDPHGLRRAWEPACGAGHMVHGLADYFGDIFASDVFDYDVAWQDAVLDFLGDRLPDVGADWIITNPPFRQAEAFVRAAWPLAGRGVAVLARLAWLEGAARWRLFRQDCPLSAVAVFAERVPMVAGRWDPEASSATAYAWFVFLKPEAGALSEPRLLWAPPGSKTRLSRRSDLDLFAPGAGSLL